MRVLRTLRGWGMPVGAGSGDLSPPKLAGLVVQAGGGMAGWRRLKKVAWGVMWGRCYSSEGLSPLCPQPAVIPGHRVGPPPPGALAPTDMCLCCSLELG